ncbi:hypothetical protein AS850_12060 [Frondihabitans sp. 762G35]|uniref:CU044_5270 family protein n=1 Tax=Frondihabitans sp. 762G35 TaxID=1446794 RepID=UPI000D21F859|nr:CU044_5270 family protein [Frondihabitans sp. 762G35]ARC57808.1 hypothetical protein AS850_12060 [Frondihabitans sp. 762G35]
MDELTSLRTIRDDVEEFDAVEQAARRRVLLAEIEARTTTRPVARRIRTAGWITGGSVVAAGLVTLLVVGNVVGLAGWRGGADAAAAATLDEAARASISNSDPVVGPGQYLEISTRSVNSADADAGGGQHGVYLAAADDTLYVPADTADDWVWVRGPSRVDKTFGALSARAASLAETDPGPTTLRAPAGAFYDSPAAVSPEGLAALPRDPRLLLNRIYRTTLGSGNSPDGEALVYIADTLRSGIVPADLRAALYRAAAMIPGVTLTEGQANLDGRTGVAIGRAENNGTRQEIIVDPSTGLLIGERTIVTDAAAAELPVGTAMESTSVTTRVVDSAPSGGTVCGDTVQRTMPGCH